MPLAETASIFNETLLSHLVLQKATEEERFTLLESSLMEATQTVVDVYSRYLFESDVVETRADHSMSVDELKDAMLRAQDVAAASVPAPVAAAPATVASSAPAGGATPMCHPERSAAGAEPKDIPAPPVPVPHADIDPGMTTQIRLDMED